MADSHATKHTSSAAKSHTIHPQLNFTDKMCRMYRRQNGKAEEIAKATSKEKSNFH